MFISPSIAISRLNIPGIHGFSPAQCLDVSSILNISSDIYKKRGVKTARVSFTSALMSAITIGFFIFLFIYLLFPINTYIHQYYKDESNPNNNFSSFLQTSLYEINEKTYSIIGPSLIIIPLALPAIGFILLVVGYIVGLFSKEKVRFKKYIFYDKYYELVKVKNDKWFYKYNTLIRTIVLTIILLGYIYLFVLVVYPPTFTDDFYKWSHPLLKTEYSHNVLENYDIPGWSKTSYQVKFVLPVWTKVLTACIIILTFAYIAIYLIYSSWHTSNLFNALLLSIRDENGLEKINDISDDVKHDIMRVINDANFYNEVKHKYEEDEYDENEDSDEGDD